MNLSAVFFDIVIEFLESYLSSELCLVEKADVAQPTSGSSKHQKHLPPALPSVSDRDG